jgi:general secretion pathway protein A
VQPPASIKALGDPIYEAFYGLKEQPFAITTDPRFFYLAASHQRAFSELLNGLRRREGILLLTGETGTGKTTLCRAVIEALGDRTFAAMVLNPYMTGAEVLRIVLRDFGLVAHEDLRRGALASADVPQLLDTLEGFLQSLAPLGSHAVIILDEAQAVPPQTLDQLRLLTALEQGGQRLVQLVLCGQAGLLNTLKADNLSALNERITRRVELAPLPGEQVEAYIHHRLAVAGGAESVSFDSAAARAVAELSRGLPRRINVLCDRALQEGRIEGATVITAALVKRAAKAVAGVHDTATAPATTKQPDPPRPAAAPRNDARPAAPPATVPAEPPVAAVRSAFSSVAASETAETTAAEASQSPFKALEEPVAIEAVLSASPDRQAARQGVRELTFGQQPTEAQPAERTASGWRKIVMAALAGIIAMAGIGYALYVRSIPPPEELVGPVPAPPVKQVGDPAVALQEPVEFPAGSATAGVGIVNEPFVQPSATRPAGTVPETPGGLSSEPSAQFPQNRN